MITLGIDNKNDIYINSNGNIVLKHDIEAMADIYVNKCQTNRGELVYNTDKGIQYFSTVFCSPIYPDIFQNQLINELSDTKETIAVSNYNQEIKDGILSYTVDCHTTYGNFILNG